MFSMRHAQLFSNIQEESCASYLCDLVLGKRSVSDQRTTQMPVQSRQYSQLLSGIPFFGGKLSWTGGGEGGEEGTFMINNEDI